jgi:ubiquinone/menaquinone biosynthesis C-methylase UbiE
MNWVVHDASLSPYVDESFDAVFMSHLLHHVAEPITAVKECNQVFKSKGMLLNRYGAIENIRDDVEHRFFPETLEIDEARIPSIKQVEGWFMDAGFDEIASNTISQQTYRSAEELFERIKLKSTSVLTLISQSAFEQGLEALQEYLSRNPTNPWLFKDRMTLTVGRKSS